MTDYVSALIAESSFEPTLKWVTDNPWWAVCTVGLSVLLGGVSTYFTLRALREKRLCYALRTINLVRDVDSTKMPGVTMSFAGYDQSITNVSVTRLALWNSGRETITKKDVKKPVAVQISGDGNVILSVGILAYSPPDNPNEFTYTRSLDGLRASIEFDFIDRCQGIVLQILHTGLSNKNLSVIGYIQGPGAPKYRWVAARSQEIPPKDKKSQKRGFPRGLSNRGERLVIGWAAILLPIAVFVLALVYPREGIGPPLAVSSEPVSFRITLLLTGLFALILWPFGFLLLRRGVPRGLKVFEED